MYTLELTVRDKLLIPNLFPEKDNLTNQIMCREIEKIITISQEEVEKVQLKANDKGGLTWNSTKDKPTKYNFTETQIRFLKENIDRLDKEKKISREIIDTVLKIKDSKENTK